MQQSGKPDASDHIKPIFEKGELDEESVVRKFRITASGGKNYNITYHNKVAFPEEKAEIWEEFIKEHLEVEYWNEYLTEDKVIFLFHLENGFKRYEVNDYVNDEVLSLCEKLCDCKFESIKKCYRIIRFIKQLSSRLHYYD